MFHSTHDLRFADAEYLDIHALAARLGVRVGHVRVLVAKREIPCVRVGRLLRFDWIAVRQWLADAAAKARQAESIEDVG